MAKIVLFGADNFGFGCGSGKVVKVFGGLWVCEFSEGREGEVKGWRRQQRRWRE